MLVRPALLQSAYFVTFRAYSSLYAKYLAGHTICFRFAKYYTHH